MLPTMVPTSRIRTTQDEARLDPSLVGRSMDLLREGWDTSVVPPIKGYFYVDGVEMTDGHHRYAAAQRLGLAAVPVVNEAAMRRGDRVSYAAALKKYRRLIDHPLSRNHAGEGLRSGRAILPSLRAMLQGADPFPTLRDFYASRGHRRQVWIDSLDAFSTSDLQALGVVAQEYGTAAGVEMKDAIAELLRSRWAAGSTRSENRAVDGRLDPEERASIPSKIERRLELPEALRGFSIRPANDVEGAPGTIWAHREPDGATIVQKIGGSQFVRIDPLPHGGYEARVWYRGLRGDEPTMGRRDARRTTLDAAVTWARDLLTRHEREATVRQRMEAGLEEGGELAVGAVVRFRDRGARRRYVVAKVNRYPTWVDYNLVALSGGEAGSAPSGVRREQVVLDDDQVVRFTGAGARKLERKFDTYRRM